MSLAHQIAQALYPNGKIEGTGNGGYLTCCPVHGDKHPSMSIWDDGKGGVNVDCKTGCNYKDIKDTLRNMGLLEQWSPSKSSTTIKKPVTLPKPAPLPEKEEKVSHPWQQADRDHNSDIQKYFINRSLHVDPLPLCFQWGSYKDKQSGETVNMIVAAASRPDDKKVYAVQRLFIDIEDHTKIRAKMLGKCPDAGRGVWIDRKNDLEKILVGEGIETVLSARQATGKNGVAALSTAGMNSLIFPQETETIYILVDSDPVREKDSMPGQKAAYKMAEKFIKSREGRQAFLVSPDDTCFTDNPTKLDFNDLLQADPTGETIQERFTQAIEFRDLEWVPQESLSSGKSGSDTEAWQDQAKKEMFEQFVFLASQNKIIDTRGLDIRDALMVERAFVISQAGKFHKEIDESGQEKIVPLTRHWLTSNEKLVAEATKYRPGSPLLFKDGDGRTYYNTFRMPYESSVRLPELELEERLRPWSMIMDTVFHQHRPYIEDWLSFSLQQPEKRAGIMPVCISQVGLGKSLIMAIVSRVVGHHNFSNGKILDITGLGKTGTQWGDWIFNKKISCIEEIDPEGETGLAYKILDALKDIITNETLSLNLKHGRNGTCPIYTNIIGFSNHKDCIKIPYGDRRMFVVDSTGQELLSRNQYGEIWAWMSVEANIIAVFQYLMGRQISDDFIPGQAMMTDAKRILQVDGRSTMQAAFDLVREQFPSDLLTMKELSRAVSEAMLFINEDDGPVRENLNADRQFQAILKSTTTLVAQGKRIRVLREGDYQPKQSSIRAIRNGQSWTPASTREIQDAMYIDIPEQWILDDGEDPVPF